LEGVLGQLMFQAPDLPDEIHTSPTARFPFSRREKGFPTCSGRSSSSAASMCESRRDLPGNMPALDLTPRTGSAEAAAGRPSRVKDTPQFFDSDLAKFKTSPTSLQSSENERAPADRAKGEEKNSYLESL
jgi:hypothetical protein